MLLTTTLLRSATAATRAPPRLRMMAMLSTEAWRGDPAMAKAQAGPDVVEKTDKSVEAYMALMRKAGRPQDAEVTGKVWARMKKTWQEYDPAAGFKDAVNERDLVAISRVIGKDLVAPEASADPKRAAEERQRRWDYTMMK